MTRLIYNNYVVLDSDYITDIISTEEPRVVFYDKTYQNPSSYKCDCDDCLDYYKNFPKHYPKTVDFLASLALDLDEALEVSSYDSEDGKKIFLVHYILKGYVLKDKQTLEIEDLNLSFISDRVAETFWPSPNIEGNYDVLEIEGIEW